MQPSSQLVFQPLRVRAWFGELVLAFRESTRYAVNTVCWLFAELVSVVAVYFVWRMAAPATGSDISLGAVTSYFLVGQLLHWQVAAQWSLSHDIESGALARQLLLPRDVLFRYAAQDVGASLIPNVARWILFGGIAVFHYSDVSVASHLGLLIGGLLALESVIISNQLSLIVGCTTFFTQNGKGVIELVHQLRWVLGGFYFPLHQVFGMFGILLNPLAWTFYLPAAVATGSIGIGGGLLYLTIGTVWIALLHLVLKWIWGKGLRRYEAFRM
jgi:ABC-2 type transport system permease protein